MSDDDDVLEPLDYTGYFGDIKRVSHAVSFLSPPPNHDEILLNDNTRAKIREQIRFRKQVMAGLDVEIQELKNLLNGERK